MTTSTTQFAHARLGDQVVEIPRTAREDMQVSARIFADVELWRQIQGDRTLGQLVNVATLPGVLDPVLAMPDAHEGYGFPVGGVAAFDAEHGIISPGGVGYDINCGVRLLVGDLPARAVQPRMEALIHELSRAVPAGAGRGGPVALSDDDLTRVLADGSAALVDRGMASDGDLDATEARGRLSGADPDAVSRRARQRGRPQLGTVGSGNHFVEVQEVEQVLDDEAAGALGMRPGQCAVLIHTGSRGLGHQVCTDHVHIMDDVMPRYGITLPDRELACAPFASPEGRAYYGAMCAAANFAFANRQAITHAVRRAFARVVSAETPLRLVYDVAHNMAKLERHRDRDVLVHRKGATRAFGPGHPDLHPRFRSVGQPVLIPGSMGTASYLLAGTDHAMRTSYGTCCHGAGRVMSRRAAKRFRPGHEVRRELTARGIVIRCPGNQELAEEAPHAYKDVDRVVAVVHGARLARKVARLVPRGVVKG